MKVISTKRYKDLLADSQENTAREVTIMNLEQSIREKESHIKQLQAEVKRLKQSRGKAQEKHD